MKRKPKNHYRVQQLSGKLCLVDLAGSERAAETNNGGQKLRDGANINKWVPAHCLVPTCRQIATPQVILNARLTQHKGCLPQTRVALRSVFLWRTGSQETLPACLSGSLDLKLCAALERFQLTITFCVHSSCADDVALVVLCV